jgi:hypothetical protein
MNTNKEAIYVFKNMGIMSIEMIKEILKCSVDRSKSNLNQSNILVNQNIPIGSINFDFNNPSQKSIKNSLEKL